MDAALWIAIMFQRWRQGRVRVWEVATQVAKKLLNGTVKPHASCSVLPFSHVPSAP